MKLASLITLLSTLAFSSIAQSSFIRHDVVVPGGLDNIEGNSSTINPFGQQGASRYQQVYAASSFTDIPQGGRIVDISFRADWTAFKTQTTTISNIVITLSTTSKAPDSLSPVFDENLGADVTVIFSGQLLAVTAGTSGNQPARFDDFVLPGGFDYDPRRGNLLLEVRNISGATLPFNPPFLSDFVLDSHNVLGDSTSSIRAPGGDSGIATSFSTSGLVTRFGILAVPEPSTWALGTLWLMILYLTRRLIR